MQNRELSGVADLIKASDAARLLSVTPRTLANWSDSGTLTVVRVGPGQRRYYSRRDIDDLLRDGAISD